MLKVHNNLTHHGIRRLSRGVHVPLLLSRSFFVARHRTHRASGHFPAALSGFVETMSQRRGPLDITQIMHTVVAIEPPPHCSFAGCHPAIITIRTLTASSVVMSSGRLRTVHAALRVGCHHRFGDCRATRPKAGKSVPMAVQKTAPPSRPSSH